MSAALSTSLAPCLINAWQPRACGEWIEPGIAKTSRPASAASRAVISEPDCTAASTTSVPRARPAMIRLRIGKFAPAPAFRSRTRSPAGRHRRSSARAIGAASDSRCRDRCRRRRSSCRRRRARLRAQRRRCRARARTRRPSRRRPGAPRTRARSRALAASGCGCRRSRSPAPAATRSAARVEEQRGVGALEQRLRVALVADRDRSRARSAPPWSHSHPAARRASNASGLVASAAASALGTTWARAVVEAAITASASRSARAARAPPTADARGLEQAQPRRKLVAIDHVECRARRGQARGCRIAAAGWPPSAASLRLREAVAARDRVLDRQDQRVRHAVEDAEHEQHAVPLVGQLDLVRTRPARSGRRRPCRRATARARGRARCRRRAPRLRATIWFWPAVRRVAVDRDDLAGDRRRRRVRYVVRVLAAAAPAPGGRRRRLPGGCS